MSDKPTHQRHALPQSVRDGWVRTYATTAYHELPWFSSRPYPWVAQVVRDRIWRPGTRILDVGCGAGTNALYLARLGYRVTGVDVADGAVAAARSRAERAGLDVEFHVADALQLPFEGATFGGAIDVGCFHSLPIDLRPAYSRELARVLRPGGAYAVAWVAREYTAELGPPHRPSLNEVTGAFEEEFLFRHSEYRPSASGWRLKGVPSVYCALLERRSSRQPPPR